MTVTAAHKKEKAVATSALITALAWDLYDHRVLGRNASLTVMVNRTE